MELRTTASILLIDDSDADRTTYAEMLAAAGYSVTVATSGEEAIAKAAAARFDLVILGLVLPKINGVAVIRTLRSHARTKTVPIIALSPPLPHGVQQAIAAAGADYALDKPPSRHMLELA